MNHVHLISVKVKVKHNHQVSASVYHLNNGSKRNMEITSEDHRVLIGNPAKFTTPVEPWMQFFHSGSSAILTPGKSFTGNTREELTG